VGISFKCADVSNFSYALISLPGVGALWNYMPIVRVNKIVVSAVMGEGTCISGALVYDSCAVDAENVSSYDQSFSYIENQFRAGEMRSWTLTPTGGMAVQVKPVSGTAAPVKIALFLTGTSRSGTVVVHIYYSFEGRMNMVYALTSAVNNLNVAAAEAAAKPSSSLKVK